MGGESGCSGGHDHDHEHDHSDHVHDHHHHHEGEEHKHDALNTSHEHAHDTEKDANSDHKHHHHDHDVKTNASPKRNINIDAAFLHVLGDMIMSIGVIIAATCIYINPEWAIADPLCTYFFSLIVCVTVLPVLKSCFNVLFESAPPSIDVAALKKDILAIEAVEEMHDFHIWSISVGKYAVTAHVHSKRNSFVLKKINNLIKSKYGIDHITIQVEDTDESNPDSFVCHQKLHKAIVAEV